MKARVGTSGWQYADWRGAFYPAGLPQRAWLEHYATVFDTVEVNNAFYRLPERHVFEAWAARVPPGFVVAVKGSRFLTHIKRLREPAEPVARLLDRAAGLGDRLGPVLLQLPPTLRADPELLDQALARFPSGQRVAVEPRHDTWWCEEVRAVLVARGAALVWADRAEQAVAPLWRTADWGYLRLHRGGAVDDWSYSDAALAAWAQRLTDAYRDGEVFAYCNNDPGAAAPRDALRLRSLLSSRESAVPD